MSVIAYHLIWTNYGTWLPNDLRGSMSEVVYTPALAGLGEAHYGRRAVQPSRMSVRQFYRQAEPRLQFPVLCWTQEQIDDIGRVFADTIRTRKYTCYACAIMPDHVHVVIRKHKDSAEAMIDYFQTDSRLRFSSSGAAPPDHPIWTKGGWKRFLDSPETVRRRIRYVENNPIEVGLPRQDWSFVVPYDNWPFHKRGRS
jgi:REP element-mobilizing transposase RayT